MIYQVLLTASALYDSLIAYALLISSTTTPITKDADGGENPPENAQCTWHERVALLYGRLWTEPEDDNRASRSVIAWHLITFVTIRMMAVFYDGLIAAALQTFIMQAVWLTCEMYCGIMIPRAGMTCVAPSILFGLTIGASRSCLFAI